MRPPDSVYLTPVVHYRSHVLSQQYTLGDNASGDLTLLLTAIQASLKFAVETLSLTFTSCLR